MGWKEDKDKEAKLKKEKDEKAKKPSTPKSLEEEWSDEEAEKELARELEKGTSEGESKILEVGRAILHKAEDILEKGKDFLSHQSHHDPDAPHSKDDPRGADLSDTPLSKVPGKLRKFL